MSDTVERLLEAAEARIRAGGFHAVSFRDLAADLGIKSASVHYHFPQKEDLGVAVVERYRDRFFTALDAAVAPGAGRAEKVAAFCRVYRAALTSADKVCLCGVLGAEAIGLPPRVAEAARGFLKANIDWLTKALDGAADAPALAACSVASLQGGMMLAVNLGDRTLMDRVIAQVRTTLDAAN